MGQAASLVVMLAGLSSCATGALSGRSTGRPAAAPCPSALVATLPPQARDRLVLRVQRIFSHPRMAALVAEFFDDASERAVMLRAERYGYDARTLERAAIAWTARGSAVYVAAGPMDGAVIARRFWDRLISSRQRRDDPARNERIEGELATGPAAMLVRPACGVVAYQEGREGALVDRVMSAERPREEDPQWTVWWRSTRRIESAPPEGAALLRYVRAVEVHADPVGAGMDVELWLEGALPEESEQTLRRVASALAETPLGELSGAVQWTTAARMRIEREEGRGVRVRAVVPWGALEAIARALAGRV